MSSPQNSTQQFGQSSAKQCRLCRQHGVASSYLDHKICPFDECKCYKCNLIKLQRRIMAEQIRLRRKDDNKIAKNSAPYSNYNCQRCKNHNIEVSKKKHNDCPYTNCNCELCVLARARSYVELEIKQSCTMNRASRKIKGKGSEMNDEMIGLMYDIFAKNNQPSASTSPTNLTSTTSPVNFQANQLNFQANQLNYPSSLFQPITTLASQMLPTSIPNPIQSSTFVDSSQFIPNFLIKLEAPSSNNYPTLDKTFTLVSNPPISQTSIQHNYQPFNLIQNQQIPVQSNISPSPPQLLNCLTPPTIDQKPNLFPLNFVDSQYLNFMNLPKSNQ